MELYICVIVVLSIVVGIPTCIKSMEFILMYKFCKKFDEDENAYIGGVTICEALTNMFSKKRPDDSTGAGAEELTISHDDMIDDEYADMEATNQAKGAPLKPSKPPNKCVVCCRAFFCCKTANIVSKEAEMAQIKVAQNTAERAKNGDKDGLENT